MTLEERYNRLHQIGVLLTIAHDFADELSEDSSTDELHATIQLALDQAIKLEDAANEELTKEAESSVAPVH